ncbi:MAG: spore coat U domain-containing protein [Anaeromyxobacteraceae bacterium]
MTALRAAVAASLLAVAGSASAACTIFAATGPAFGTYDVLSTLPLDAAGAISYRCTPPRPQVLLSTGSSGTFAARTLRSGDSTLQYNLYLDSARTQVWGDGSGGSETAAPNPGNVTRTIPIFGRIPARQDAAAGAHFDTIVVTFVF